MDEETKAKYARLINNLQSIAYRMENVKTTIENIKPAIKSGLLKNDNIVEEDTINDAKGTVSNQKNRLYSIIRTMYDSMNS